MKKSSGIQLNVLYILKVYVIFCIANTKQFSLCRPLHAHLGSHFLRSDQGEFVHATGPHAFIGRTGISATHHGQWAPWPSPLITSWDCLLRIIPPSTEHTAQAASRREFGSYESSVWFLQQGDGGKEVLGMTGPRGCIKCTKETCDKHALEQLLGRIFVDSHTCLSYSFRSHKVALWYCDIMTCLLQAWQGSCRAADSTEKGIACCQGNWAEWL